MPGVKCLVTAMSIFALVAMGTMPAQPKPGAACTILTLSEATAILGPGTAADMAVPEGKARMCTFRAGKKRLSVSAADEGPLAAMRKSQLEELRKENSGKVERGLGDYAVSFTEGDVSAVMALKGGRVVDARTIDAGASPELFKSLRAAALSMLSK